MPTASRLKPMASKQQPTPAPTVSPSGTDGDIGQGFAPPGTAIRGPLTSSGARQDTPATGGSMVFRRRGGAAAGPALSVRHLRTTCLQEDQLCFSLFEGPSPGTVGEA